MISPKITNLGYSNLWTDMSTILGYASNFDQQIQKLFANGEQGFAYDPNDLSTMYQDATGTVPVTGVGQPVGLMRDKSGRNNHAYQTTSASRPILRKNAVTGANYLEFDGSDDFLQTSNIDFTATDKVSLFVGVRKLRDAASAIVAELSVAADQNNGAFSLLAPGSGGVNKFATVNRGTKSAFSVTTALMYSAPYSAVLTAHNYIPLKTTLSVNRIALNDGGEAGTGKYGNYPLYIGRRAGTSLPFNGHIYSLIGVGKLVSDDETVDIEKEIAKRTGVTLNV